MSKEKRKFTVDEKVQILKEASERGINATLNRHGINPAAYYNWKKKFELMGEEWFWHGITPALLKEINALQKEKELLKKLPAEKSLI